MTGWSAAPVPVRSTSGTFSRSPEVARKLTSWHTTKLRAFIDQDLLGFDEIWAAAGTPQHVFRLDPEQLLTCTDGARVDLAQR